jgi:hypothetical protein
MTGLPKDGFHRGVVEVTPLERVRLGLKWILQIGEEIRVPPLVVDRRRCEGVIVEPNRAITKQRDKVAEAVLSLEPNDQRGQVWLRRDV